MFTSHNFKKLPVLFHQHLLYCAGASLQDFIQEVESKTPFKFTFDERETLNKVVISITAKNETLEKVLARVYASRRLEFKQVNSNIHVRLRKLNSQKLGFLPMWKTNKMPLLR
jgi:hypothetical protein